MAKNNAENENTSVELLESVYKFQLSKREIVLNADVDDKLIEKVVIQIHNFNEEDDELEAELKNYDRNDHPIMLYVNSRGGYIYDGMAVVSAIRTSKTPVHTIALGKAMSMGFMILIAGHRRYCQPYSWMMYHQASANTYGTLRDMEEDVEQIGRLQAQIEELVKEFTMIPEEVLESYYLTKSDLFLNSEQALEYAVVDEILSAE